VAVQATIVTRLPARARWWVGESPLDFDFSNATAGLRQVASSDVGGEVVESWRELLIVGSSDYAEGGGASAWVAVRRSDGAVCGRAVEREEAVFALNSTVEQFIRTFALLDRYLSRGHSLPSDIEAAAREIDPASYPCSEWRSLIDNLTAA